MSEDASFAEDAAAPRRAVILLVAGIMGLLLAATVALWAHYGTAIFFETIRAGLAACFG
jgi:uncharacterized protein involved in exopolysaccharide biosynthesis